MSVPKSNETEQKLARLQELVSEELRKKPTSGANLSHMLRREIPGFSVVDLGYESLTHLMRSISDQLVVIGRQGNDYVWALGETLSDQALDRALGGQDGADLDAAQAQTTTAPPSASLTSLDLRCFRSCLNVHFELAKRGPTAIVGPNGSGKSTLLMGLSYATQVTRGRFRALFSGRRDVRRLRTAGSAGALMLQINAGPSTSLGLAAEPWGDDTRFTVTLKAGVSGGVWTSPGTPPKIPLADMAPSRNFWPSVLLRFRAEALAAPSEVMEGEPRLAFDGSGLPTFLAHLATTDPDRLQALVENVRKVVPAVRGTRQILREAEQGNRPEYHLEVKFNDQWIPADLLSEGTLFALGLHAVLHQQVSPRLLLMDDIDRGLHPKAQRALVGQLNQLANGSGPQIVFTTHSPFILDELPPENVRVVRMGSQGTIVRALTAHPEWHAWKESMSSGEFWTYVGEDWLEQTT